MKKEIVEIYANPQERQIAFFNSRAKYRLYWWQKWWGKSRAMRAEVVRQALSWKVRWLVLRRTTDEIQENMLQPMMLEIPWRIYKRHEKRWIMKFHNWSTVKFWYCRNLKDVLQYQWVEFDFICIEELTHRSEEEFRILMSSLRSSKKYVKPNFFWSTNPWWRWHWRVKRLRINRDFNTDEDPTEYDFIPASIYDNAYLLKNNPEYLKSLLALPDKLRRAYLEGDRDVFAWQFFTEFRRSIHVIETPFVPVDWIVRRIICVDYWFTNPSAVYRLAQDSQWQVFVYRELYVTWKTYKQLYLQVKAMTTRNEKIDFVVADPAVVNKKSETWWLTFKQTRTWFRVIPWKNNRSEWRSLMRDYIHETASSVGLSLKFTSNCVNAIRTIPELVHDDINVEDVNTKGDDHAGDSIRYGLLALWVKKHTTSQVMKANTTRLTVNQVNKMIKQRDNTKSNNVYSKSF
jgi:phage terminase large subunit